MATYSCRIYINTGFNAVNVPDGPTLLDTCSYIDVPSPEIFQSRFLSKIRVRSSWDNIKDGDYVRLSRVPLATPDFYFITGITMLSKDTCELDVLYDFVTSAGGVANLNILDGVTSRVHVTDDTFGKYAENDPLTIPAHPLELDTLWFNSNVIPGETVTIKTYVEATINLAQTGASRAGKTYYDGEDTVIIPTTVPLEDFTEYAMGANAAGVNPHTMLYDLDNTDAPSPSGWNNQKAILEGIKRCRELGIEEGAIINQVQIPTSYVQTLANETQVDVNSDLPDATLVQRVIDRKIYKCYSKTGFVSTNLNYEYSGANNNRVNYGEYTKYGIITCSGESCEYNAEDIKDPQNPTAPVMKYIADPHTDGKPYFRWRMVNGDTSDIGFFRNCVSGLQWKQVPLFFDKAKGSALNTLRYQNSRNVADESYKKGQFERVTSVPENIVSGTLFGLPAGPSGAAAGAVSGAVKSLMTNTYGQLGDYAMYYAQKRSEMSDYFIGNTVSTPVINFPYNSEVMRDFYGNGCLMYRYKYSASDISRIDKLLTMYGYRYTKALEKTDFTNKQNFNYVECANVSITGMSRWMCEGVAMMLKNGVRVWHVLPNPNLYTQVNANAV